MACLFKVSISEIRQVSLSLTFWICLRTKRRVANQEIMTKKFQKKFDSVKNLFLIVCKVFRYKTLLISNLIFASKAET